MKTKQKQFSSLFILPSADPLSSHLPRWFNVLHCPPHSYSHTHTRTQTHSRNTQRPTLSQIYEDHISLGLPFFLSLLKKCDRSLFCWGGGEHSLTRGGRYQGGVSSAARSYFHSKVGIIGDPLDASIRAVKDSYCWGVTKQTWFPALSRFYV